MDKIIDGVDVSKCRYLFDDKNKKNLCSITLKNCKYLGNDCYYKQLQRAKAEIEELKKTSKNNETAYHIELGTYNMECGNLLEENKNLIEENEQLKNSLKICQGLCETLEKAKANEHNQWFNRCCEINTECDKYRQAMQEIREIAKEQLQDVSDRCINTIPMYIVHKHILDKINEVIGVE